MKNEVDNESHICHNYSYNQDGQPAQIQVTDASGNVLRTSTFTYDDQKRLVATTYGATGHTYRPIYESTVLGIEYPDGESVGIQLDGKYTDQVEKDNLGRVEQRTLSLGLNELLTQNYSYLKTALSNGKTIETGMISGITGKFGECTTEEVYTYDVNGNIETVTIDSELMAKYTYDSWNRLVREDNYVFGKTYTFEYDLGGNLTQRKCCCICEGESNGQVCGVDTFQYAQTGWKDQLISYNGKACTYDALGNLTRLGDEELEWTRVRKLARFGDVTFTYDAKGMRTGKTKNGVTHSYIYEGDLLLKEIIGNNTITYYHGNDGIIGFNYLDTDFLYRKNLQGDVIAICTADGTVLAKYVYDAWGNHKVYDGNNIPVTTHSHIGYINPIRYRGYYYDVETKLYYCQTRYYSPELCRFIQPADVSSLNPSGINGLNLYSYVCINPIGISHSSSNVDGLTRGGVVSSFATNIVGFNAGYYGAISNSSNVFGALVVLSTAFGFFDQWSGYLSGGLDAGLSFWGAKGFGFRTLGKYSSALKKFGIGMAIWGNALSWGSSVYNNFTNPNYTTGEAFGASAMDAAYYAGKGFGIYWLGSKVGELAVSAGIAAGSAAFGTAVLGTTVGFVGALAIGGGVAVLVGIAGAVAIYYLGEWLDDGWNRIKKQIFK